MKRKTLTSKNSRKGKRVQTKINTKGTLVRHLQVSLLSFKNLSSTSASTASASNPNPSSRSENFVDSNNLANDVAAQLNFNEDAEAADDKDFILSQDFFCTPDYITPDNQQPFIGFNFYKDCPKSPEKLNTVKNKRCRLDDISASCLSPNLSSQPELVDLEKGWLGVDESNIEKTQSTGPQKTKNYVSQSAIALRCRVMPPPCIRNPYLSDCSNMTIDPFDSQRSKCAGLFPSAIGPGVSSRYHAEFHEIEEIGSGNFSRVFRVLNRIDGCLYAVKKSTRQLHQEYERRKALMEVQALAALGSHSNVVGYYSSWLEDHQLYIQMELCESSLSISNSSKFVIEGAILEPFHQIAKALQFIHEKGIAHLDLKPDNIFLKNGVYKLGDFGCATLLDKSLPVEEGDAHYMPQEILNEQYDHLDKVDIYSLGVAIYELVRGSPLVESGPHFLNLKEGKLPLLPGRSLQFQNLLKAMLDPDPVRRPSARELVEHPIFDRVQQCTKN